MFAVHACSFASAYFVKFLNILKQLSSQIMFTSDIFNFSDHNSINVLITDRYAKYKRFTDLISVNFLYSLNIKFLFQLQLNFFKAIWKLSYVDLLYAFVSNKLDQLLDISQTVRVRSKYSYGLEHMHLVFHRNALREGWGGSIHIGCPSYPSFFSFSSLLSSILVHIPSFYNLLFVTPISHLKISQRACKSLQPSSRAT